MAQRTTDLSLEVLRWEAPARLSIEVEEQQELEAIDARHLPLAPLQGFRRKPLARHLLGMKKQHCKRTGLYVLSSVLLFLLLF